MPSAFSKFQESEIVLLKDLISVEYGHPIFSKTDCDKLVELIELRTSKLISANTLRRFFEVMPNNGKPSLSTLNILAQFCGFTDFFEFQKSFNQRRSNGRELSLAAVDDLYQAFGDTPQFYQTLNWLVQLAFRDKNIHFLKGFFGLQVFCNKFDYTQGVHKEVLMTLGSELQSNPKQFDILIEHYATNPLAQSLYFECFIDYDFLPVRHHKAIQLYSQNKTTKEAQLFSLCMLFLHCFLLKDRVACSDLIKRINRIDLSSELHPFPVGRRMACNILFQAYYLGGVKEGLIKEIFDFEIQLPREGSLGRNMPCYHTLIAEAFCWAGYYDEALSIILRALDSYKLDLNYHTQGLLSSLWITYSDSLLKSGRKEDSHAIFNRIEVSHFDVHNKNFSLMHYYNLNAELQKESNPKVAASLKRSSLEIASNYKFKFFQTLYS